MLSDEQIQELSASERADLMRRLARPLHEVVSSPERMLRRSRWRLALIVVSAVVLVPWIVYLAFYLPRDYDAPNWDRAWVGFDVILLVLLTATAFLGWRRRQLFVLTGFAAGMLLVCDAWFDVLTSRGMQLLWSALTAVFIELPLAFVLISGAVRVFHISAARIWQPEDGGHVWQIPIGLFSARPRRPSR